MLSFRRQQRAALLSVLATFAVLAAPVSWPTPASATASSRVSGAERFWRSLIESSRDLGPSRAAAASVFAYLSSSGSGRLLGRWAARHGVAARFYPGQLTALLYGPPRALGQALGVQIDDFESRSGEVFYAAERIPRVPPSLRTVVAGLGRVSSYGVLRDEYVPGGGLTPTGFLDAYDAKPLVERGDLGQGQTIVFFEIDGYARADFASYQRTYHPDGPFKVVDVGPDPQPPGDETPMDIEVAHGIAPDARLVYLDLQKFGSSKQTSAAVSFEGAFSYAARHYPGAIWSISLGLCEEDLSPDDEAAVDREVAAAESAGTTVFAASGDEGGLECLADHLTDSNQPAQGISFPGNLPHVTSVGGTSLSVAKNGTYVGETAWTEPLLSQGTTGGISTDFAMPSWQSAPGVVNSYSSRSPCQVSLGYCREIPDVSAVADPLTGAAEITGTHGQIRAQQGGTSLATPVWAGFAALIDAYLMRSGRERLGFVNPLLYGLARNDETRTPFHTILAGSNDFYPVTPGYNMATGLGSPDVWHLAVDLVPLVGGG
jgi:kumamolisin